VIIRARFQDFGTKEELKAGRSILRSKVKEGLKEAAQRAVLPVAKRGAPAIAAQALTTKSTAKGAYLTTIGPRKLDSITGLLNFGGNPRGFIYPKKKQALRLRGTNIVVDHIGAVGIERGVYGIKFQQTEGRIRARYKGKHFLEAAIDGALPAYEALTMPKVLEAFGTLAEP
jgi:hypothetical protein